MELGGWPPWVEQHWPWLAALALLAFFTGCWLTSVLSSWKQGVSGKWSRRGGLKAEKRARKLLKKQGYRVLDVQPRFEHQLIVDGEPVSFSMTPDMIVERDDQEYVVEIKRDQSGVRSAVVRRQVLEYLVASKLPCLLVTMPDGEITEIDLIKYRVSNQ